MQPRQVSRVLEKLKEKGFIETAVFKANGHPTSHYRPVLKSILQAVVAAEKRRD
jgi:hypothetical protein